MLKNRAEPEDSFSLVDIIEYKEKNNNDDDDNDDNKK
jgi:hypothetical protein